MLQHQMSLLPLQAENSPVQTSDGFNDFTFAASNSNQLYNSNVADHLIHIGNLDDQLLSAGNPTWMKMSNENLNQGEEREREKSIPLKDDFEGSKRRKIKRDQQVSSAEPGEYSPIPHQSSLSISTGPSLDEGRERKSSSMIQQGSFLEEPSTRLLGKEAPSKMARRDLEEPSTRS